jgi:hypothetical protein
VVFCLTRKENQKEKITKAERKKRATSLMIHCNTLLTVGAATVDLKIRRHTEAQERESIPAEKRTENGEPFGSRHQT